MRFKQTQTRPMAVCLAIYGRSSLEKVCDFINQHPFYTDGGGAFFTAGQLAGQYAFEQAKLDRKGYETRKLEKYLAYLSDTGANFDKEEALEYAEELINKFTADFGRDEDGEATFRIKAQSFRLKKYDCLALWSRVKQATSVLDDICREKIHGEEVDGSSAPEIINYRVSFKLVDPQNEVFAALMQYVTIDAGKILVEDFFDYELLEYPNFHDESNTINQLLEEIVASNRNECISAVRRSLIQIGGGDECMSYDESKYGELHTFGMPITVQS